MKINEKEISRAIKLSRLELTSDEKKEYSHQLSDILEYVEKINELDTKNVNPSDHIVDLKNIFREDINKKSLNIDDIEKIAPEFENNHFVVPKMIDTK
jgi:aspartyl-tRNA(Asn)/glutamyl-tRNA(Gln) amidotransferase subunit C